MRRFAVVVAWLVAAHAALGGVYYGLLHVPESTVWMLGLSALLAAVLIVGLLVVNGGALLALFPDMPIAGALQTAARRLLWVGPALLLFAACWWAASHLDAWHAAHRGEIDASLMVRFNWRRTAWLHRTLDGVVFVLRYVIGASLALAWAAAGLRDGVRALARPAWIRRGLDPRALAVIAAAEIALVEIPWRYVYWRPRWVPPTRAEILFVGAKLSVVAVLFAVGWAVILWVPAWRARAARDRAA